MTPSQAADKMREIASHENGGLGSGIEYQSPDEVHSKADELLCELLRECGYGLVVDEYLKIGRYFS